MRAAVEGGRILDAIKKKWTKWFNKFGKLINSEEIETDGVSGQKWTCETKSGNIVEMETYEDSRAPEQYLIRLSHDDGKDPYESNSLLTAEQIEKKWEEYCKKYDLGKITSTNPVEESSKICVTLKKVAASSDIHLCAINAGATPSMALKMLDDVLEDEEFAASIPEAPMSFEIVPTDECYEISEIAEVDTQSTFEEMLKACVECYHNLQSIHWGAKTSRFNDIHSYIDSLAYGVQYHIDTIAEWCVEYTKKVPNVLSHSYSAIDCGSGFDFDSAMITAKELLDRYICILETYYVNVEHDVQSVLDNWIRDLKKQSNYVLDRSLVDAVCGDIKPVCDCLM